MATLGLTVKSDFAQAEKDLKNFAALSESTGKALEKFQEKFKNESVDRFIDKQNLSGIALKSTRGALEANEKSANAYRNEIERLIKNGLNPQDESVKKLTVEYNRLQKEIKSNELATESLTSAQNLAATSLLAIGAAAVASGIAIVKNTFDTAKYGDELAETAQKIGLTAESLQEYQYVAEKVGTDTNTLQNGFQKLNKNLGELQSGYGSLNDSLQKTNPELLKNLQNAQNSDEAFSVAVGALSKMDNQFEKTALAQQLFGKSGAEMLVMTDLGVNGLNALKNEVRDYGIMTNAQAQASSDFTDAQLNLQKAFFGVKNELSANLMPAITNVMKNVTSFIVEGDGLKTILEVLSVVIPGVTAGLVAFLVVTKGAMIVETFTLAVKGLTVALASNPFGVIAVAITAVLIPAIIWLVKNWDFAWLQIQKGIESVAYFFQWLGLSIKEIFFTAIGFVRLKISEFVIFVSDAILGTIQKVLEVSSKIPFIGEQFKLAAEAVKDFKTDVANFANESIKGSNATIEQIQVEKDALKIAHDEKMALYNADIEKVKEINDEKAKTTVASNQIISESIKKVSKQQQETILQNSQFLLSNLGSLGESVSTIMKNAGKDTHKVAVAQKAIAIAMATVNTAAAIVKTLAQYGTSPWGIAAAAVAGVAGAAQVAAIASTPIPSAQTGTSSEGLVMPQGRGNVSDRIGVMASPGETINVTPRGEESTKKATYNFFFDKSMIFSVVQDGIDSGEINITTDNIKGAVFA